MLLNAAAESIPYATHCSARNAHLAQNAAKCCKNAGKFFPDVVPNLSKLELLGREV